VRAIMLRDLDCNQQAVAHLKAEAANPLEELFRIMVFSSQRVAQMNPVLLYDLRKYYPSVWSLFLQYKINTIQQTVAQNLDRGVAAGLYRSDLDVAIVSRLFISLHDAMMDVEEHVRAGQSLAAMHHQMMFLFLYGITTTQGHEMVDHYRKTLLPKNINI